MVTQNSYHELKLFVGSGNLGNAEPDASSIAAWIPEDGNCAEFLDNQKYPIVKRVEDFDKIAKQQEEESESSAGYYNDESLSNNGGGVEGEGGGAAENKGEIKDRFDIVVLGMQESTFEPANLSDEMLDEIKARLDLEDNVTLQENLELDDTISSENMSDRLDEEALMEESAEHEEQEEEDEEAGGKEAALEENLDEEPPLEKDGATTPSKTQQQKVSFRLDDSIGEDDIIDAMRVDENKLSVRSAESMGDESIDTVGNESVGNASAGGNDSCDSVVGKKKSRSSKVFSRSVQKAAKGAGKAALTASKTAGKATKTASKTAFKGALTASITAGKATKTAGKTAGKAAVTAGKTASKAAVTAGKTATKAATTTSKTVGKAAATAGKTAITAGKEVAKVGEMAAVSAEKAARKGVGTVKALNTLTASREHKKDNGQLISDGTAILHQMITERLPSYKRLLSFQRGEMRLLVYSLETHHIVKIKSVRAQNTGVAGLANKGGIVAECIVGDGTVLSFMSCHLEAHEGISKYAARCSTLGDILKGTKKYAIPSIYPDCSLATHYCFVMGDLNFRTRHKGRIKSEEQLEDVTALVDARDWKELNEADELRMALENQECLYGFKTLFCNFMPTFKLERQEGYYYKAQRTPSYTDRILWRTGDKLERMIEPLAYEPIDNYATSDHKPIRGAFAIKLNRRVFLKKREPHVARASVLPWKNGEDTSKHENLHLFLCDIQCDIFPNAEWSSKPDSYVCLISSPEDILLKKPTKFKQMTSVMKKFLKLQDVKEDSGEHKEPKNTHNDGWPRTGKIKSTYNPNWKNREIHCVLKTHAEDGSPINLTGAILHIFVFKHNGSQMDQVIGSYPINLENIYRSCTLLGSHSMRNSWRAKSATKNKREAHDNMVSLEIDGPLLKNGRQTGVLRCTIDAWWIIDTHAANAEAEAEAAAAEAEAEAGAAEAETLDDPSSSSADGMMDASDSSYRMRGVSWIRKSKSSAKKRASFRA